MKFIKKLTQNKVKLLLTIIIVLIIILIISTIVFFTDNSTKANYGNRLDGIEEVEIQEDQAEEMVSTLEKEDKVSSASYRIQGKIVNVTIEVKQDTSLKDAKALTSKVTESYDEEQVKFYDFQVFINNKDEKNSSYPIIGYKKATADSFSFTKDRGDN